MSESDHCSGDYLGTFEGLVIRGDLESTGRPVLEVHGEDGMAAVELTADSVDGLTEAAAEASLRLGDDAGVDTDDV